MKASEKALAYIQTEEGRKALEAAIVEASRESAGMNTNFNMDIYYSEDDGITVHEMGQNSWFDGDNVRLHSFKSWKPIDQYEDVTYFENDVTLQHQIIAYAAMVAAEDGEQEGAMDMIQHMPSCWQAAYAYVDSIPEFMRKRFDDEYVEWWCTDNDGIAAQMESIVHTTMINLED